MFGFGFFSKKETVQPQRTPVELLGWRPNMWVMSPDGIGIIFKLGVESEVHLTDEKGLTIESKVYPIAVLRQAKFTEIPVFRRKVTKEVAANLGYF